MNEDLQKALAEIITGALQSAEQAKAFVLAEMPEVVQQLLLWKMAESLAYCALGVGILLALFFAWRKLVRLASDDDGASDDDDELVVVLLGLLSAGLILFAFIGCLNITWLQIWLAPKVYLIEYAADLIK